MKVGVDVTMGQTTYHFEFEGSNEKEVMAKAFTFGNPPTYNKDTKNSDPNSFALGANKDKDGNIYIYVVDKKTGHKANLGTYKSGGYFWKDFEKWDGTKSQEPTF